ncbi:MAG: hypothetical protein M1823_004316 [Watsoniomyces obsoletus]|nr:MAG: hypothetical protein M1823_004316 [Watsoniomyces obsoletus]
MASLDPFPQNSNMKIIHPPPGGPRVAYSAARIKSRTNHGQGKPQKHTVVSAGPSPAARSQIEFTSDRDLPAIRSDLTSHDPGTLRHARLLLFQFKTFFTSSAGSSRVKSGFDHQGFVVIGLPLQP